jgi:hypothetical protein
MKRALPYLLLAAEAVVFFRHVLFLPGYIIPWDLHSLHVPYVHLYAEALSRGEFPLWDPYTYCGRPLFATIQAAVLYPTVALAAWAGSAFGRQHIEYLLDVSIVLHVALAGIFAYLLARRMGLGQWAALCGATIYELSGYFAAHAEHMADVICAAWLPLAWYAVLRWRDERGLRPVLMLAAVFALSILSGNPPAAAFVIGFTLLFAVLLPRSLVGRTPRSARDPLVPLLRVTTESHQTGQGAGRGPGGPPHSGWRLPLGIAAAAAFAVLLTAVQLVPTYELTENSVAKYRGDYLKGGVPPQVFLSLILPNHYHVFDPPHYNGPADLSFMYLYCGILGVGLAVAGAAMARRHRLNLTFGIMAACAAVALLGDMTRLTHALYALLPAKIAIGLHPEMASMPFTLALAMLAALAAEQIVPGRLRWAAAAMAAVELILVNSGRPMNAMPYAESPAERAAIARLHALTYATQPPARIDTVADSLDWVMSAPQTGIYTASGADIMAPERIIQVRLAFTHGARWGSYYQVENQDSPVVGMMNVRYLLTAGRAAEEPALARFRLVTKVRPTRSMQQAAAMLRAPEFNPAGEAIIEGGFVGEYSPDAPPGTVTVVQYGLQSVELKTHAPTPQFLVTSETHYPGWRAWVDGRPQHIYYTNVAFRGLWVPAGNHTVRMRFEPASLPYTAVASALGWLWLLLWGGLSSLQPAFSRLLRRSASSDDAG